MYRVVPRGVPLTKEFRVFIEREKKLISPWRDIPLRSSFNCVHMVTEIPAQSRAKFEICTEEDNHPIKQDINNQGNLRFLVPKIPFNYGALPQTLGLGDGDPLDVVDLAATLLDGAPNEGVGKVRQVRILGGFCLMDQGEEDWKILGVDQDAAIPWKSLDDVPKATIESVMHWFKTYKTFEGKQMNTIRGGVLNGSEIEEVIAQAHKAFHDAHSQSVREQQ